MQPHLKAQTKKTTFLRVQIHREFDPKMRVESVGAVLNHVKEILISKYFSFKVQHNITFENSYIKTAAIIFFLVGLVFKFALDVEMLFF